MIALDLLVLYALGVHGGPMTKAPSPLPLVLD